MDDEVSKVKEQKRNNAHFVLACARGYADDVKALLDRGADLSAVDKQKVSGLHFACGQGRLEVVNFLWTRGAELDAEDPSGNTALHYAVIGAKPAVVDFLLAKGAWVEGSNSLDDTPLHIAARKGHGEIVAALLSHGAKVTLRDVNKRGLTALGEAVAGNHASVADALIKAGASLAIRPRGMSLLQLSASLGCAASAKLLLDAGAKVDDASDDEGMTALHCAALSGSVETVKLLLARGGDPAAGDIDGRQPQDLVARSDKTLKDLLKTSAAPKRVVGRGRAATEAPKNDLEEFKSLDDTARKAKIDGWAAIEDPKQLERTLLEFPAELQTQLAELRRLRQILNLQQAIMDLLEDDDFQVLAERPNARSVVEEVHSNREAFRKFAEDQDVMDLLRALQRFQNVVRANGGHQIPFQSLLRSCEQGYQEKSLMRLKGMRLMLDARRRAALAAALAGSEAEAKASAEREMDIQNQPKAGASAGPAPREQGASAAAKPPETRDPVLPPGSSSTAVGGSPDEFAGPRREPFSWKRLWREAMLSVRNALIVFSFCLVFMYFTGQRLPWEPSESSGQAADVLEFPEPDEL